MYCNFIYILFIDIEDVSSIGLDVSLQRDLVLLSGAVDEVEQTVSRLLEFSNDEFIECDSVVEGLQSDTGRVESYLAW